MARYEVANSKNDKPVIVDKIKEEQIHLFRMSKCEGFIVGHAAPELVEATCEALNDREKATAKEEAA